MTQADPLNGLRILVVEDEALVAMALEDMLDELGWTPEQARAFTARLQSLAASTRLRVPIFVAVDHEGGPMFTQRALGTVFPGNMALGATRGNILQLIVGDAIALAMIGIAAGSALAFGAGLELQSLLAGLRPADPDSARVVVG